MRACSVPSLYKAGGYRPNTEQLAISRRGAQGLVPLPKDALILYWIAVSAFICPSFYSAAFLSGWIKGAASCRFAPFNSRLFSPSKCIPHSPHTTMSDVEKARTSQTSHYDKPANFAPRSTKIANPGALYVPPIIARLPALTPPQWSVLVRVHHIPSFFVQCKCKSYPYPQRRRWHGMLLWRSFSILGGNVGVPPRQCLWCYRYVSSLLLRGSPSPLPSPRREISPLHPAIRSASYMSRALFYIPSVLDMSSLFYIWLTVMQRSLLTGPSGCHMQ